MNNTSKLITSCTVCLLIGGYIGYTINNSNQIAKQSNIDKLDNTAICRLELRDGQRGEVKNKYIALLEYRVGDNYKEFCEKSMLGNLPDDTYTSELNSLQSEDEYSE